jgi:hypothetical protein
VPTLILRPLGWRVRWRRRWTFRGQRRWTLELETPRGELYVLAGGALWRSWRVLGIVLAFYAARGGP